MSSVLSIKDWGKHFENSESRKLVSMKWIPIPNKHDGMGYGQLWQHKKAVDVFAAWILILQVASKCDPRGTLVNKDGLPITPIELSVKTRAPKEIFEIAIPVLISIGWISGDSPDAPVDSTDTPVGNNIEGKGITRNNREKKGTIYTEESRSKNRLGHMSNISLTYGTELKSNELKLSNRLLSAIQTRNPGHRKPDLDKWAHHIDLMIRIDKRDPAEIEKVIDWCQADTFWQNNILSTEKLREQYDQLILKMGKVKPKVNCPKL